MNVTAIMGDVNITVSIKNHFLVALAMKDSNHITTYSVQVV